MRWTGLMLMALVVSVAVAPARGQGGVGRTGAAVKSPDPNLPERALEDALSESMARNRLLVVVTSPSREKEKANRAAWNNRALQQWVRRYAVLVHVSDPEMVKLLRESGMVVGLANQPLVFRAGKQERIFGSIVRDDGGVGGERLREPPKDARVKANGDRPDTSIRLLMRLEWTRRSFRTRDEAWWTAHERDNPAVDVPEVPYASAGVSDKPDRMLGDAVESAWGKPDPVARLLAVIRDTAGAGGADGGPGRDADSAAAVLTWLWERGPEQVPSFSAAAFSTVARTWHALGEREAGAKERARQMHERETALVPSMDDRTFFAWMMLGRIADEYLATLDFLDAALDDADARLIMPSADRALIELMLPWLNWADPRELPGADGDGLRLLKQLRARLKQPPPAKAPKADADRVLDFAQWLMRVEGARVYAAMLAAGEDGKAREAAEMVTQVAGASESALWLVTAALCERQPRAEQQALLEQAKGPWARRLEEILKDQLIAVRGK